MLEHPFGDMPIEDIGDLTISPRTDIPFGKPFRMGLAQYTIYDRAVEQGYHAGIQAHLDFLIKQNTDTPVMLDDAQFTLTLQRFCPSGLNEHNAGIWRASFIAGWAAIYLGLAQLHPLER